MPKPTPSASPPKTSPSPSKGPLISKDYCLLSDLGEGTFGSVKLGMHVETENRVAVKILEKSRIKD